MATDERTFLAVQRMNTANLSFGGILKGIGRIGAGLLPGGGVIQAGIDVITSRGGTGVVSGPGTGGGGPCGPGKIDVFGQCVDFSAALPFGDPFISRPPGPALPFAGSGRMALQGGGFAPVMVASTRSDCGPKHVLGFDGLCYKSRGFPNKDRMWPKGRAPLLTGGERNAITTAARAARKIERTTKQLQKMGMIKKPSPRRRLPAAAALRQLAPGPSIINVE